MEENRKNRGSFCRGIVLGALISLAVVLALLGGLFLYVNSRLDGIFSEKNLAKLLTIETIIDKYYYEDVDTATLVDGMYDGIIESLGDDYADYYSAEEYQDMELSTSGTYGGIGATMSQDAQTGQIAIVSVYEGSPAEEAGLEAYDIIVSADGYEAQDMDITEFVSHVRGEEGTTVELVYERDGEQNTVEITRRKIDIPSVSYEMLDGHIGYVQITEFTSVTAGQFESAMDDLSSQGMTAVVFDVRSNLGGMVDSVVEVLDYVLPEGTVLTIEDKNGKQQVYTSDAEHYIDMPIVVLTDGYTASAAEIFAGAIRDFDYGTLIGTKTFGKGIVQISVPLTDGSAVKVTTAKYYTPSGECIHKVGITPDIELEYEFLGGSDDSYEIYYDNQIRKAVEVIGEERESDTK